MTLPDDISSKSDLSEEIAARVDRSRARADVTQAPRREIGPESEVRGGPEAQTGSLDTTDDVSRSGSGLYPDDIDEREVQECAYYLWKNAGEPEGRHSEFWDEARAQLAFQRDRSAGILTNPIDIDIEDSRLPDNFRE